MLSQAELAPELAFKFPNELDMISHWKLLAQQGIHTANVFNLQPAGNNIELCFTNSKEGITDLPPLKKGKYLRPDLKFHLDQLWAMVEQLQPNLVIAFGNTACWAILGESKISSLRGTVKMSPRLGVKVLPTYHPAAVLRQWNLRTVVLQDLEKAKRESTSTDINRIKRFVTIDPTLADIEEWAMRPADYYAVDIETEPMYPISMIGFARSEEDAIVVPFYDPDKGNYWCPRSELAATRLVDRLLRRQVPKVFQNGVFDLSHLLRWGMRPTMCDHDTMLLHHSLYPEMLKGLGFLGSIYSDEIAWKTMRKKGNNLKRDE